jgi:hypothetical protein
MEPTRRTFLTFLPNFSQKLGTTSSKQTKISYRPNPSHIFFSLPPPEHFPPGSTQHLIFIFCPFSKGYSPFDPLASLLIPLYLTVQLNDFIWLHIKELITKIGRDKISWNHFGRLICFTYQTSDSKTVPF